MIQDAVKTEGISLDDLMRLDEDEQVEIFEGELVYMSPVGVLHHIIVSNIMHILNPYVRLRQLGMIFPDGLIYLMNSPRRRLRDSFVPDVSFLRASNIPPNFDITKPHPGSPNLAVEVVSPGDDVVKLQKKVRQYLKQGSEQVWVMFSNPIEVHQYRQDIEPEVVRVYKSGDVMDVEALFPDLTVTVDAIYELPKWLPEPQEQ